MLDNVRGLLVMCMLSITAGCFLLEPDYPPCQSRGAPTPAPDGPPGTGDPNDPGDYGADKRYRKLKDGTVCLCGTFEVGCHETPEGADSSMACAYNAGGQRECEPASMSPPPDVVWNNETGRYEPATDQVYTCVYDVINRRSGKVEYTRRRDQRAPDLANADARHTDWCTDMSSRRGPVAYRPGPCQLK